MKNPIILCLGIALIYNCDVSYGANCNELLQLGYTNINHSVNSYDSAVSAYNFLCSESYSSVSTDKKRGMSLSFDFLKKITGSLSANWGNTLTQTSWNQVCSDKALSSKLSTFQSINSSEISAIALNAWTECLNLNARGLKADFSVTPDLIGLTGTLYWNGSTPIYFTGVSNNGLGAASCNVTYYDGKQYINKQATDNTLFMLDAKSASFNCKRTTYLDNQKRIAANSTRITLKTSEGKLDFDLSPITLTQVDVKEIDGIYQKVSYLDTQLSQLNTQQQTQANQLTSLDSANKFIISTTCPTGWKNYGQIGIIAPIPSSIFSLIPRGGRFNPNWDWAHPNICVRQ